VRFTTYTGDELVAEAATLLAIEPLESGEEAPCFPNHL